MIDVHCHLEQKDFDPDREQVIEKCKKEMKAAITCCSRPDDFDITMKMAGEHKGFVFACAGIHPIHIKETSESSKEDFLDLLEQNRENLVAIGEAGLDYHWVKEPEWREKQKDMFRELIEFSRKMNLPLVVHSRDAMEDTISILEECGAENVMMHLFGSREHLSRVVENKWSISIGPIIRASKNHKKIARDVPIENLMLETDSPWFGFGQRSDPTAIKLACEKIAEARKISFDEVWKKCGANAVKFFKLPLNI